MTPREKKIREFLAGPEHVCPFGRDAVERGAVRILEVSGLMPQESIHEAVSGFLTAEGFDALVLVGAVDPPNHEAGRIEAGLLNIELSIAMDRATLPDRSIEEIAAAWNEARASVVGGQAEPLSPLIGRGKHDHKLYAIAMGPQFGKAHPRFALHLCLIVIRAVDLESSAQASPRVADGVRRAVHARLKEAGTLSGDPDAPRLLFPDEFYSVGAQAVSVEEYDAFVRARMAEVAEAQRRGRGPG